MRDVVRSVWLLGAVAIFCASTASCASCIRCKTDQDCGSMGRCVDSSCKSPKPGE